MPTHLSININSDTNRVLRWAEIEHGRSPQEVLQLGVTVLKMLEAPNIVEVKLVAEDGTETQLHTINPEIPSEIYDF